MKRYFFDVTVKQHRHCDYRGCEFERLEKAREWAELFALDLGCCSDGEWEGAEIQVHGVHGNLLFSVPIPELDLIAA